ncbi:MAG: outer membrane beta-barrel domain-containing protein [Candidatus Thiodiazotropha sp. (ex Dulcina madagascariensis)]|nr:outer membrane beta-barrel domain-containing protein [Candidatus Thiodiazotropha sp. (ex Epidulcina cf. delphinae)]MCU7923556.1 outer membrane beta-barrel domain-containing protein [Candidatus Thiodiazotropha sp. (ex Dulcina madagascariensis)]MCU7927153.1 outer membrane beta-barrel domain-containing protein [Candidatus Thiodiazotropha sp. (ex Dulcina madagascariensis)]
MLGTVTLLPCEAAEALGDSLREELLVEPEIARREIKEPEIDAEDFEVGAYVGLMNIEDFGTGILYGARLAYHGTDAIFLEAAIGTSKAEETSYEALSGDVQLLTDSERKLTYYNLSAGYNILPGEVFLAGKYAYNSQFYLIGGIGSTRFAGDDEFTINLGAGYRLLINDWLTLHLDARDHMFESDLLGETKTTHNFELHGSLTIFF